MRRLSIAVSLAPRNRGAENIGVETVVISELKFRDVQRHIFGADLVETANDPALEDAPEAFNRVRVYRTDHVLFGVVIDRLVLRVTEMQPVVSAAFIGREQADAVANCLAHERFRIGAVHAAENAGDHVALAADRANDRRLTNRAAANTAISAVFILGFAADVGLINLNDAAKLGCRFDQRRADFVAHAVGRLVRAEAHLSLDLKRANPLLAGQQQVDDLEPLPQRLVGILENGPGDQREPIAIRGAPLTLPVPSAGLQFIDRGIAAAGASDAIGPAAGFEVMPWRVVVMGRKHGLELGFSHLVDWLRTFSHLASPSTLEEYSHA